MAYTLLEDFSVGIDLRKSEVTQKAGGMRQLSNAFINAGGEIERRRKFGNFGTVPSVTMGLAGVDNRLYVFGLAAPGSVSVSLPIIYQQLVPSPALGGGVVLDRILSAELFQSQLYVIARFSDGSVRHFYNGAQVAGTGNNAQSHRNKLYTVGGSVVKFSAVGNAADWVGTGSGSIDVSANDQGTSELIGIEPYYNSLALFGRRSVQVWAMASDPAQNQFVQTLTNAGSISPNGMARYGGGDVLFLSDTGVRSIRARDSSNAAVLDDIGSPIDNLIQPRRLSMTGADADRIKAIIDPLSGHFWLVWGSTVYVLSYYPATKVTAWATFDLGFVADYVTSAGNRIAIRSGNNVYLYGDASNPTSVFDNYTPLATVAAEYDNAPVVASTPMLDFGKPATLKTYTGIDLACEGVWAVDVCPDPAAPGTWVEVAIVTGSTYGGLDRIPYQAVGSHLALRFRTVDPGFARLGAVAIHYTDSGS